MWPRIPRWMYPVERCMKIYKGYMKNPRHPEASIVERYVAEEAIEFCTDYLAGIESIGVPYLVTRVDIMVWGHKFNVWRLSIEMKL